MFVVALIIALCILIFLYVPCGQKARLLYVGEGYAGTSVNTAVFRKNSVCTRDSMQFIAFYNPEGVLTLGKRLLTDTIWQIHETQYSGDVTDAHKTISIAVDDSGYLHVAFNHHDSPLTYTRSTMPFSLMLDTLMPMLGEKEWRLTYPEFYNMKDKLLFAYRDGSSGNGNLVLNTYSPQSRQWTRLHDCLIDGENERSAYWQIYVSRQGTIHVSWVWRETWDVATNHDLCYACSHDEGKTWQRTDGTLYSLPITIENAETIWKIPQGSELINQTSITADESDMPYVATYWRDSVCMVPQYRIVYYNGCDWKMQQVSNRTLAFSLSGGGTKMIPMARPQILVRKNNAWLFVRDAEYGSRAAVYITSQMHSRCPKWKRKDITDFPVNAWEPSLDTYLWQTYSEISLFLQNTMQGDGERVVETPAQAVYCCMIE